MCDKYINFHTHHRDARPEVSTVMCFEPEQPVLKSGNASIGIHPWSADKIQVDTLPLILEQLAVAVKSCAPVAIGETGLDRLHNPDNLPLQQQIFEEHLRLAEIHTLPVIIHCVRCYPELLCLRKKYPNSRWMIHGYNNKVAILEQLLKHDCYISIGPAVICGNAEKHLIIQAVPLDRLCLETDDADGDIKTIYQLAAKILNLSEPHLVRAMNHNFTQLFGRKP